MHKLVPPEDNFLSQSTTIISIQRWETRNTRRQIGLAWNAAIGACHDRTGRRISTGLKEIVDRHALDIDRVDAMVQQNKETIAMTPSHDKETIAMTPSHDKAMEALGSLGTLSEEEEEESPSQDTTPTPRNGNSVIHLSQQSGLSLSQESGSSSVSSTGSRQQQRFQALSQSYYKLRENEMNEAQAFEMSQRVERGEGHVVDGAFETLEDFIDPETLTPYEDFEEDDYDDDGMYERRVEEELSTLATQTFLEPEVEVHGDAGQSSTVASSEFDIPKKGFQEGTLSDEDSVADGSLSLIMSSWRVIPLSAFRYGQNLRREVT
jgi:hypothetical protein